MSRFLYFDGRQVYDGWAYYRCRIETREKRGKTQWRYVIERRFVATKDHERGRWSTDEAKVREQGEKRLDSLEKKSYPRESYL